MAVVYNGGKALFIAFLLGFSAAACYCVRGHCARWLLMLVLLWGGVSI
jgi:hypothetical protein